MCRVLKIVLYEDFVLMTTNLFVIKGFLLVILMFNSVEIIALTYECLEYIFIFKSIPLLGLTVLT